VIAGARTADGKSLIGTMAALLRGELFAPIQIGAATTLGVVATDAVLTKSQANKMAQMAHDGFARAINPVHTMTDGDTIFALATGASGRTANVTLLGALGAEAMARAIVRAVLAATSLSGPGLPDLPAARDL
jgi:L-aminopeptidase/D-esterase-like protein